MESSLRRRYYSLKFLFVLLLCGGAGAPGPLPVTNGAERLAAASSRVDGKERIKIPLRTWIARSLPAMGKGPCPTGCKHMRLAHNSDNDRIYFLGGDYGGPNAMSSARNELYSYSVAENNWKLEYPYCGVAGEMQPDHPDEVGWAYDNRRKLFWLLPGFLWNGHQNKCPEGVKLIPDVLQFDPSTRKWTRPAGIRSAPTGSAERGKFAVYDPKTDRFIQFHRDGGQGSLADILDIQSGRWKTVSLSHDSRTRQYLNNAHLDKEYMAADFENRHVYVIDPIEQRLLRFHLDGLNITSMGPLPAQTGVDFTIPVWDSVNKVLLWPRLPNLDGHVTLYIYHPDTNSWEKDSMRQPEGLAVRGNSAVFDPSQNVLLLIGGLKGGDTDPSLQHFFLYRYGNGRGEAAEDSKS